MPLRRKFQFCLALKIEHLFFFFFLFLKLEKLLVQAKSETNICYLNCIQHCLRSVTQWLVYALFFGSLSIWHTFKWASEHLVYPFVLPVLLLIFEMYKTWNTDPLFYTFDMKRVEGDTQTKVILCIILNYRPLLWKIINTSQNKLSKELISGIRFFFCMCSMPNGSWLND